MTNHKKINKDHVVETAAKLFFEKGFVYTSMDEIVRVSNVSKSNVYYHFSNKDELLVAVIDFWIELYQRNLEIALSQINLSVEKRTLLFLDNLSIGIKNRDYQGGCPFITLAIQAPNNTTIVKEKIAQFFANLTFVCERLIQEGIETKEFKQGLNPAEISQLFITNLEGALFLAEIQKDNRIITTTAKQLFKLLV
ncbi:MULTISPECIES: TetR/AcrR family transcriptional regulator [Vagococcus]|uniref:Transcriptional regulator, TetR family n=1 Tax=Vagococcus fluvialis bH819 TaxID=1255619 RepID=A0A1X6WPI2_9ENTE|nr:MULTISPECIES: TetR/AcrR family transcriptional regulator [Vagococcus]SLM86142.1 Transcriptional regulator, TetR family [Vagococcus fluvialis bH819]HCM90390.1 TetR/AcrR family transcriptional regulator [Vagococcus sp.]